MIGTILALATPLIQGLIPLLEKAFKGKPKEEGTNPKMDILMGSLSTFLAGLMGSGVIDKTPLDKLSPELKGAAEKILADMKADGSINVVYPQASSVAAGTQYVGVNFQDMIILRQVK